jgi:hypothetical protein
MFPGIKTAKARLTSSRVGAGKRYFFFQFEAFNWEGVAYDAADAKAKAWQNYMEIMRAADLIGAG